MENAYEKLTGGNLSSVYRYKETVLREQKPWSPTIPLYSFTQAYCYSVNGDRLNASNIDEPVGRTEF